MALKEKVQNFGPKELEEEVLRSGLCTKCGACVNLCPYIVNYQDNTLVMDSCSRHEGRCYAFCPRTPTDIEKLRQSLFDPLDFTPEVGSLKGFHITRAADPKVRESAQHGGTVSALIALALEEGLIDTAVLSGDGENFLTEGIVVNKISDVKKGAKSKFVASSTIAAFNQVAKSSAEKVGVVATPCQTLALGKMRLKPFPNENCSIEKLRLVIGLFCGWALSWPELKDILDVKVGERPIIGLDIPPSRYNSMEVHTDEGIVEISLDEVSPAIRKSCSYCFDLTAEFSDLSVGSARLPEGWEVARGWNQVIVRTRFGQELLDLARSRGVLEFRKVPDGNLERLKKASLNKKRVAVKNLREKSGRDQDLIYLKGYDPILKILEGGD